MKNHPTVVLSLLYIKREYIYSCFRYQISHHYYFRCKWTDMLTLIRRRCRRYLLLLLVVLLLYHGLSLMSHARNKKTIHVHDHAHVYKYAVISKESQANMYTRKTTLMFVLLIHQVLRATYISIKILIPHFPVLYQLLRGTLRPMKRYIIEK